MSSRARERRGCLLQLQREHAGAGWRAYERGDGFDRAVRSVNVGVDAVRRGEDDVGRYQGAAAAVRAWRRGRSAAGGGWVVRERGP